MAMLDYLNGIKKGNISDFKNSMLRYKRYVTSRSLIIIVSDFMYDIEQIEIPIYLFSKHNIKLVQVLDPVEKDLAGIEGDYAFEDMETADKMRTYVSKRMKSEYQKKVKDHIGKIQDVCNKTGVDFYTVSTADEIFDSFFKILQ